MSDVLRCASSYGRTSVGRTAKTHLQHLCIDTEYWLEVLPEGMKDRDEGWERELGKSVRAAWHDDNVDNVLQTEKVNFFANDGRNIGQDKEGLK